MIARRIGLAMGLALPFCTAAAQPDPYTVERMAPGVFAVIRKVPANGASDSNVLIIINDRDVVVVDANIYPSSARQVIGEIRKRTGKPVRYVINTHSHDDHLLGNGEYLKTYPGVEFISHPSTRARVLEEVGPSLERNLRIEYPQAVAGLETMLRTGKTASGRSLSPEEQRDVRSSVSMYRFFMKDAAGVHPIPATVTVADSIVLVRGDRVIVVKWLGRGNTAGDLVVHLPKERVVATGDLVVSPIPFGFGSFAGEWATTLRALRNMSADRIMPGHGLVMTDWAYLDKLIPMLESVWDQVHKAVAGGADLAAARAAVNLAPFRKEFAGDDPRLQAMFGELFGTPIVEAAFNQLKAGAAPGK